MQRKPLAMVAIIAAVLVSFILRRKRQVHGTGENKVKRCQHRAGAVDLTVGIFLMFASMPRSIPIPSTVRGQIRIFTKCQ